MEKSEKGKRVLNKKDLNDSIEMCEDIYNYYETTKTSISYFDINKHSVLYNSPRNIQIEAPISEKREIVVVRQSFIGQVLFFAVSIILAVFLSKLISGALIQETKVNGNSMNPTLSNKERLILDKFSYHRGKPKRYDVVVFSFNNGEHFVKRIIGLPGEKVSIKEGRVFINDILLSDDPIKDEIEYAGIASEGVVVGPDEYFVLGDNRNHSYDSRYEEIGTINKKVILGKVWLRLFPVSKFGIIR